MAFGIKLLVWGDYASFNRPEMKVERVTYDFMTPSAARGLLEAIHWKPGMRWVIDAIHILAPIQLTGIRRNEIKGVIPTKGALAKAMTGEAVDLRVDVSANRQQRAAIILKNVRYGIEAHIEVLRPDTDSSGNQLSHTAAKHLEIFKRRAEKGQFFHQPYFGTREFPAFFELVDTFPPCPQELVPMRDFGWMLHDMVFTESKTGTVIETSEGRRLNAEPRFFKAIMQHGIVRVPPLELERNSS